MAVDILYIEPGSALAFLSFQTPNVNQKDGADSSAEEEGTDKEDADDEPDTVGLLGMIPLRSCGIYHSWRKDNFI